jgi:hypothetical protein
MATATARVGLRMEKQSSINRTGLGGSEGRSEGRMLCWNLGKQSAEIGVYQA